MPAAGAVEELEVDVDGLAVAPDPGGDLMFHPVEVEGTGAFLTGGTADELAGARGHVELGLDPRGHDLGDLLHLGGQDAVGDEEDVGAEGRAFVAGADLGDDAAGDDRADAGDVAFGGDDVVELQVGAGRERDGELQRRGVLGADDAADDGADVLLLVHGKLGHGPPTISATRDAGPHDPSDGPRQSREPARDVSGARRCAPTSRRARRSRAAPGPARPRGRGRPAGPRSGATRRPRPR